MNYWGTWAFYAPFPLHCPRICRHSSKTELGPGLDKIKQLLIENRYPPDVLLSCINQKLANSAAEKNIWPREVSGIPKMALDWGMFHQRLKIKLIKPLHLVTMLWSPVWSTTLELCYHLLKTIASYHSKSCVVYEFSCRCEARYAGRTMQRLADRVKQHVPTSIRKGKVMSQESSHLV